MTVRLQLLGGASLSGADGPFAGRAARSRQLALLVLLASEGVAWVRRDKVVAWLWPESSEERARHSLSDTLYVLREELGKDVIEVRGGELRLNPSVVTTDLWEFREALEADDLARAIDLYGGPLLDGVHLEVSEALERWVAGERDRLARRAAAAALARAERLQSEGDLAGAERAARRALAIDPVNEAALRRLLGILDERGNRSGAIRAYDSFARRLRSELEVEPDPETEALVAEIRSRGIANGSTRETEVAPSSPPGPAAGGTEPGSSDEDRPHRWVVPTLAGTAVVVGAVLVISALFPDRPTAFPPPEEGAAIAVLPFEIQGEGLDLWREGMVDVLSANLDGVGGLRAIDSRTLLARWRERVKDGEEPDLATSLEAARRTGARFALVGSAMALGRDLRLTANIYELSDGRSLGQARVQGSPDSVYMLVDQLSIEVLHAILGGEVEDLPRIQLVRVTTASLPALKAYLEGEALYRKADWEGALAAYREAVEADSTFALAWHRVAESINWIPPENRPEGVGRAAREAIRWSARLPERESVLVRAHRALLWGSTTMLEPLESTSRRYPDDPELAYLLGEFYFHSGDQLLVDPAETERVLDHAIELDPSFGPYYIHAIEEAFYRADSARALDLLATFEGLVGDAFDARFLRLQATLAWGSPSERSTALAAIDTLPIGGHPDCRMFAAPRFSDLQLACARAVLENGGNASFLFYASLGTGKIETFHEVLRAAWGFPALGPRAGFPVLWPRDDFEVATLYYLRQRDLPVDGDRLREAAAYPSPFFAILAAEDGRTDGVRAFQEITGAFRDSLVAEGDSLRAGRPEGMLRMIEGYVALQQGERERALALLVEGQKGAMGATNSAARWTIADLLVDLGRPEEAIPYYRSFRFDPFAAVELGKIYQRLGRVDQAREQYETALAHWRDADPVLAPRVAEVRQRLAGLEFQPRS